MLFTFNQYVNNRFSNKDKIKLAKKNLHKFVIKFCDNINNDYIYKITCEKNNHIYIYNISSKIDWKNEVFGIIIYRIILIQKKFIRIYIPLLAIHTKMRGLGYGRIILDEFISKYNKYEKIEIVLLSLKTSFKFYKKLGFKISDSKYILKNEVLQDSIIMKLII